MVSSKIKRKNREATKHFLLSLMSVILGISLSGETYGEPNGPWLQRESMTAYFRGVMTVSSYQSEIAGTKDIGSSSTITIGSHAGLLRSLNFAFVSTEQSVPYSLNNSQMDAKWQEVRLSKRMGWFSPTLIAGSSQLSIRKEDTTLADVSGTSVGGGLSFNVPLWNHVILAAEGLVYAPPTKQAVSISEMGQRVDQSVEARFNFKTFVDFIIGYQSRSFSVTTTEAEYEEKQLGGYSGIQFGLYF